MKRYQIKRILALLDNATNALVFVPLHEKQDYLRPVSITEKIYFNEQFALVANDSLIPKELWSRCPREGQFLKHCYQVIDTCNGMENIPLGIYLDRASAQSMIDRLVNSSRYGKVWEISVDHLTPVAFSYLHFAIIGQMDFQALNFELFYFPGVAERCVAVKLMATPWTDENLFHQFSFTAKTLMMRQQQAGLPDCFIELLHKTAQEDVRILVFDPLEDPVNWLKTYK